MEGKPGELKHLSTRRRRKQNVIPPVVASEEGTAQTTVVSASVGLKDCGISNKPDQNILESMAKEGDSPVGEWFRREAVS